MKFLKAKPQNPLEKKTDVPVIIDVDVVPLEESSGVSSEQSKVRDEAAELLNEQTQQNETRKQNNKELSQLHEKAITQLNDLKNTFQAVSFAPSNIRLPVIRPPAVEDPAVKAELTAQKQHLTDITNAINELNQEKQAILKSSPGWFGKKLFAISWYAETGDRLTEKADTVLNAVIDTKHPVQVSIPKIFAVGDLSRTLHSMIATERPTGNEITIDGKTIHLHTELNKTLLSYPVAVAKLKRIFDACDEFPNGFEVMLRDGNLLGNYRYRYMLNLNLIFLINASITDAVSFINGKIQEYTVGENKIESTRSNVEQTLQRYTPCAQLLDPELQNLTVQLNPDIPPLEEELGDVDSGRLPKGKNFLFVFPTTRRQIHTTLEPVKVSCGNNTLTIQIDPQAARMDGKQLTSIAVSTLEDWIFTQIEVSESKAQENLKALKQYAGANKGFKTLTPDIVPKSRELFAGRNFSTDNIKDHLRYLQQLAEFQTFLEGLSPYQQAVLKGEIAYKNSDGSALIFDKLSWYPRSDHHKQINNVTANDQNRFSQSPWVKNGSLNLSPAADFLVICGEGNAYQQIIGEVIPLTRPNLSARVIPPSFEHPFMLMRLAQLETDKACNQFLYMCEFTEKLDSDDPIDRLNTEDANNPKMKVRLSDFVGKTSIESALFIKSLSQEIQLYEAMQKTRKYLLPSVTLPDDSSVCNVARAENVRSRDTYKKYFVSILQAKQSVRQHLPAKIIFGGNTSCCPLFNEPPRRIILPANPNNFAPNSFIAELQGTPDAITEKLQHVWHALELEGLFDCPVVISRYTQDEKSSVSRNEGRILCRIGTREGSANDGAVLMLKAIRQAIEFQLGERFGIAVGLASKDQSEHEIEGYIITLARFIRASRQCRIELPNGRLQQIAVSPDPEFHAGLHEGTFCIPMEMSVGNLMLTINQSLGTKRRKKNESEETTKFNKPIKLHVPDVFETIPAEDEASDYEPEIRPSLVGARFEREIREAMHEAHLHIRNPRSFYHLCFYAVKNAARKYLLEEAVGAIDLLTQRKVVEPIMMACIGKCNDPEARSENIEALFQSLTPKDQTPSTGIHIPGERVLSVDTAATVLALSMAFDLYPITDKAAADVIHDFKHHAEHEELLQKTVKHEGELEEIHGMTRSDKLVSDNTVITLRPDIVKALKKEDIGKLKPESRELRHLDGLVHHAVEHVLHSEHGDEAFTNLIDMIILKTADLAATDSRLSKPQAIALRLVLREVAKITHIRFCDPPLADTPPYAHIITDKITAPAIQKDPEKGLADLSARISGEGHYPDGGEAWLHLASHLVNINSADPVTKSYQNELWYPSLSGALDMGVQIRDAQLFARNFIKDYEPPADQNKPTVTEILQAVKEYRKLEREALKPKEDPKGKPPFEVLLIEVLECLSYLEHPHLSDDERTEKVREKFGLHFIVMEEEDNYGDKARMQTEDCMSKSGMAGRGALSLEGKRKRREKLLTVLGDLKGISSVFNVHSHSQDKEEAKQELKKHNLHLNHVIKTLKESKLASYRELAERLELTVKPSGEEKERLIDLLSAGVVEDMKATDLLSDQGLLTIHELLANHKIGIGQIKDMIDKLEKFLPSMLEDTKHAKADPEQIPELLATIRELEEIMYEHIKEELEKAEIHSQEEYAIKFRDLFDHCKAEGKHEMEVQHAHGGIAEKSDFLTGLASGGKTIELVGKGAVRAARAKTPERRQEILKEEAGRVAGAAAGGILTALLHAHPLLLGGLAVVKEILKSGNDGKNSEPQDKKKDDHGKH